MPVTYRPRGDAEADPSPDTRAVSPLPAADEIIAVCCADIHLSHRPPLFRSNEPDWYAAMERALGQVRELAGKYDCPVLCAGDVFDRWNAPPELINFALRAVPRMISVAGNHDLPNHSYEGVRRSAYWTLVEAGVIEDLAPGTVRPIKGALIHPFPCGTEPEPYTGGSGAPFGIHVALAHKYVWYADNCYPGAPDEDGAGTCRRRHLGGYEAAIYGDNHKGFRYRKDGFYLLNCGTLMRRKADERDYRPAVGLLHADGLITRRLLDTGEDKTLDAVPENGGKPVADLSEFLEELAGLGECAADFSEAVRRYLGTHEVSGGVRQAVLDALEKQTAR